MSIVVFLGPSLPLSEAQTILKAEYRPPVAAGDILEALADKPEAFVIIDGVFRHTASVRHKEILYALSQGIRVFGASSMGALRASELCDFGMEGFGQVFEAFKNGHLDADDEVAVTHGSSDIGYRMISEAMVNLREGILRAITLNILTTEEGAMLVTASKNRFYGERSWDKVFEDAKDQGIPDERLLRLIEFTKAERPDIKREDAIAILRHIAGENEKGLSKHQPTFRLGESYEYKEWSRELKYFSQAGFGVHEGGSLPAVVNHILAFSNDRGQLLKEAMLLYAFYTSAEAENLVENHPTGDWQKEFETLLDKMVRKKKMKILPFLMLALIRRGEWEPVKNRIKSAWRNLQTKGLNNPSFEDAGILEIGLMEWYRQKTGGQAQQLEDLQEELGIDLKEDIQKILLTEYLLGKNL